MLAFIDAITPPILITLMPQLAAAAAAVCASYAELSQIAAFH
jgi:hypothetical protein